MAKLGSYQPREKVEVPDNLYYAQIKKIELKKWAEDNDASSNMFDQQLNKTNLAYYLSYVDIDGNGINLREKDLKARLEFLGTMTEGALQLYGTYLFVFLELIRKSLLSQVSVKNS